MYVCTDDEPPRVIGWTTADAHEGNYLTISRAPRMPPPWTLSNEEMQRPIEITTTTFRIVTVDLPWGRERVIKLEGDQDPASLPGWSAMPERQRTYHDMGVRRDPVVDRVRGDPRHEPMVRHFDYAYRQMEQANMFAAPPAQICQWLEYLDDIRRRIARETECDRMGLFMGVGGHPVAMPENPLGQYLAARQQQVQAVQNLFNQTLRAGTVNNDVNILCGYERYGLGVVDWRGIWGVAKPRLPRIDAETAARSRERARELLKSLLTPQQWSDFETAGQVTERINGTDFRLAPGAMIEVCRPKRKAEKWCVYPNPYEDGNDYMPDEDKLIGQLLHLRAGPEKLRERANVFPSGTSGGYEQPYGLGYAITRRQIDDNLYR